MHSNVVKTRSDHMGKRRFAGPEERSLHDHHGSHLWTRRRLLKAAGSVAGAAAITPVFAGRALAAKPGSGIPSQLEGFSPTIEAMFGVQLPFFLPADADPFNPILDPPGDPATITDFNGLVGLVEADGVGSPNENTDGVERRWAADVRFMLGVFRDREGRAQRGAFGFL